MTHIYMLLITFLLTWYTRGLASNMPVMPFFQVEKPIITAQAKQHTQPVAIKPIEKKVVTTPAQTQAPATSQVVTTTMQPPQATLKNRLDDPIQTSIVSGKQAIPVSASMPLSQAVSILGRDTSEATHMILNKIRTQQDMPFLCNLKILDDESEFTKTRDNVTALINHSPLFLNFIDTDTVSAVMPMIKRGMIAALFPMEGLPEHRFNGNTNIIYFRANYYEEISALIDYAIHELNNKKFAIFYEESAWGKGVLRIFKDVLNKYQTPESNVEFVAEGSYQKGTVNISQAVKSISEKAPTALFVIARARPAYNFISQIVNQGLHRTTLFGLSSLIPIRQTLKRSRGVNIIASSVVPNPEISQLPIAQEYRADMQTFLSNRRPTVPSFEAYINVLLFLEALKAVTLPTTINALLSVFTKIKKLNFKGLELNYEDKTLSHQVWISTDNNEQWLKSKVTE